jgi:hypothetical protein
VQGKKIKGRKYIAQIATNRGRTLSPYRATFKANAYQISGTHDGVHAALAISINRSGTYTIKHLFSSLLLVITAKIEPVGDIYMMMQLAKVEDTLDAGHSNSATRALICKLRSKKGL